MPSAIDPTFPADGTPVSKPAFRDQLLTLRAELEHGGFVTNPITLAESTASQALADLRAAMPASRVGTIAELQAIRPAAGLVVEVLGYHAPGDGGGGLFYAEMSSGLATDGGIVFGHSGDESPEQTEPGRTANDFNNGFSLAQGGLVFGSVTIELGTTVTLGDLDLHGHHTNNSDPLAPLIDHAAGAFPADDKIKDYLNAKGTTATVRYRHFTEPRRWVRLTDGRVLDVRWFGLTGTGDERNRLCWALNAAQRLGFQEVRLNGAYRYLGAIEIPDGIDFGWGTLTVVDNDALRHLRTDYDSAFPDNLPIGIMQGDSTALHPASHAAYVGLRQLELDGNYQNNTAPLEDKASYARGGGLENLLQNTPVWSGFSASNHGGRVIPPGQRITVEDVHLHGFGSNCIVGHGNTLYHGRNVRLGNSARNHVFYSIQGEWFQVTVYGFAWAVYGKAEHATFHGLRFERLTDFANGSAGGFAADGWTAATQLVMYEGLRWSATPNEGTSAEHRFRRIGFNIIGGHFDLEGFAASGPLIFAVGRHLSVRDLVVLGPYAGTGEVRLLSESESGNATLHDNWSIKNITMLQRGGSRLAFASDKYVPAQLAVEDYSIGDLNGYEGASAGATSFWCRIYASTKRFGNSADYPLRLAFSRLRNTHPCQSLFKLDVLDAGATPVMISVRDSVLNLSTSSIYTQAAGTGTLAGMTVQDLEKITVVFDNVRFAMAASNFQNYELFFALTRFRGCRTFDGRVSEAHGAASLTAAGGESHLDVATSLLWAPEVVAVLPRSAVGAARFSHYSVLASDGMTAIEAATDKRSPILRLHFAQPAGAGEDIQLAWRAAVRPF